MIHRQTECGVRRHRGRALVLSVSLCALLAHASISLAITLADPVTFTEKRSWSATTLAIPASLGGIRFSSDGSTLYAVGAADVPTSAMYAIPVIRDLATNEITDLAMASATPFFSANVSTPAGGLDSGPEEGPAGTLFYTYFNANNGNFIGERRAGDLATEMQFDLAPQGVPLWVSGLAFSPFRIDPATGFGRLQVAVYNDTGDPATTARDVYEVPLSPVGNGFFTPGAATRFLSLSALSGGTVSGLCYVPAGPFAGSLMYTSFDAGEVRYLAIDAASGLAVDSMSGLPLLGTVSPVDHLFASGLGAGPQGLDFDPLTNDLFISNYEGDPVNTIIQVGGFPSTTTSTIASTTTTTSTLTGASTSTTTLAPECFDGATFDSIACRLDALLDQVRQLADVGPIADKLAQKLVGAKSRLQLSQSRLAQGRQRGARAALGKASRLVRGFHALLGSRNARRISASVRTMLNAEALAIQADVLTLKQSL